MEITCKILVFLDIPYKVPIHNGKLLHGTDARVDERDPCVFILPIAIPFARLTNLAELLQIIL